MKLSDVWGATEHQFSLPEPEVTIDGIDCSHMTAEEAFKAGMDAGKRAIIKEFDEYFTGPGALLSNKEIMECLGCTLKELDALVVDDIEFFGMDRLPKMYQTFKRNTNLSGN